MLAFLTRQAHWLIIFGIFATAGGCLSAYFLPSAWQKADALAQAPQYIPLQELATRGPSAGPHVIVTDFTCGSAYAFELQTRKGDPADARSNRFWQSLDSPVPEITSRQP